MKTNKMKTNFFLSLVILGGIIFLGTSNALARPSTDKVHVDGSINKNINENLALGTSVGTLTTPGDDGGTKAPYVYSLNCTVDGDDDEYFQIDGDQLEVATVFDHEIPVDYNPNNGYQIVLKVSILHQSHMNK